jgi:hypothetical protein
MTQAIYDPSNRGHITVRSDGRAIVVVPLHVFCGIDGALRTIAEQAMEQPNVPFMIPDKARVPRPRNSVVHSIQL